MGEMKRLWAAVSILAALLAAALGTGWWVDGLTADYVSRLEQAQAMSERGDWERAAQVTGGVYRNWQERSFWLHALLRHSDTDQVLLLFRSVEEYLKLEEMDQYAAANAQLIAQLELLAEMEDPEFTDFWQLLGYRDAIAPEIQRAALAAEVFWPCEIYYHAPADVRDGLIHALLSAEYSSAASNLMSCLAMQGDDKAMETLLELERNPRPWRKGLYVDPSSYAQIGGWTFDKEGQKIQLNFDTCYPMVKGTTSEKSPVRIGRAREDTCPHCGGRMVDMLVLDGRDERLKFLGLDGILTATCCPNCVGFLKGPAFNSFTLDGGVEVFPSELFDGAEKTDCYVSPEDYKALTENPFVLGEAPVPLFYGAACQDVNTVGGFANWVQDAEYTTCPHCGKPMKYLAQIQWDTVFDCAEGTLYVEFCPDCHIVSMQHQQT